jgi:hypothetical protein
MESPSAPGRGGGRSGRLLTPGHLSGSLNDARNDGREVLPDLFFEGGLRRMALSI